MRLGTLVHNTTPIHFIALTAIPVLSPVLFMPSLYYTSYNSNNFFIYMSSQRHVCACISQERKGLGGQPMGNRVAQKQRLHLLRVSKSVLRWRALSAVMGHDKQISKGLLGPNKLCLACNQPMGMQQRRDITYGYRWRCPVSVSKKSVTRLQHILRAVSSPTPAVDCSHVLTLLSCLVTRELWFRLMTVCSNTSRRTTAVRLHQERCRSSVSVKPATLLLWVSCVLFIPNHSAQTLLPIIQQHVRSGSVIHSNG